VGRRVAGGRSQRDEQRGAEAGEAARDQDLATGRDQACDGSRQSPVSVTRLGGRLAPVRLAVLIAVLGLLLAGCGGGTETTASPDTVGTMPTQTSGEGETETGETETGETETGETETGGTDTGETETGVGGSEEGDPAAGRQVFTANGCGGCHAFEPAGSNGATGPDLNELSDLAEGANQPVADFTRESIVEPNAYVEEGYPEGVMPAYDQLDEKQLNDLVAFLIQPQ
jgi:hypothetical protein